MTTPLSIHQRAAFYLIAIPIEVTFNSITKLLKGNRKGKGGTSVFMIPTFCLGSVLVFEPLHNRIRGQNACVRSVAYAVMFMGLEYLAGKALISTIGTCPWEYKNACYASPDKIVNFAYAPLWGLYGLVAEQYHDFILRIEIKSQ